MTSNFHSASSPQSYRKGQRPHQHTNSASHSSSTQTPHSSKEARGGDDGTKRTRLLTSRREHCVAMQHLRRVQQTHRPPPRRATARRSEDTNTSSAEAPQTPVPAPQGPGSLSATANHTQNVRHDTASPQAAFPRTIGLLSAEGRGSEDTSARQLAEEKAMGVMAEGEVETGWNGLRGRGLYQFGVGMGVPRLRRW